MKKNTLIALIMMWIGVAACVAFAIYGALMMLNDCSHEIEDIIEAIGDFAEEAWQYAVAIGPVVWAANKLESMAVNLYKNSTKEEP